jgi:hypothetical protein
VCQLVDMADIDRRLRESMQDRGLMTCKKCGHGAWGADRGILRRKWCGCCEGAWVDRLIRRLIRRHGRKATVRILKRLK